jgi:hypothetical protein
MMKRIGAALALTLVILIAAPASARAQIQQVGTSSGAGNSTVNFTLGYFALKGIESRVDDDVLLANLTSLHPLFFEINDFNSFLAGAVRDARRLQRQSSAIGIHEALSGRTEAAVEEHAAIYESIRDGEPEAAAQATAVHLDKTLEDYRREIQRRVFG